jgi:DNA-binding beta-propeller fold protein YncE
MKKIIYLLVLGLVLLLAASLLASSGEPERPPGFILAWGEPWFDGPSGVAVDGDGNVYVADVYNHRIHKLDDQGTLLSKWGEYGSGDGLFRSPYGVAVDGDGNVYVADTSNSRIQKFDSQGNFLTKWNIQAYPGRRARS